MKKKHKYSIHWLWKENPQKGTKERKKIITPKSSKVWDGSLFSHTTCEQYLFLHLTANYQQWYFFFAFQRKGSKQSLIFSSSQKGLSWSLAFSSPEGKIFILRLNINLPGIWILLAYFAVLCGYSCTLVCATKVREEKSSLTSVGGICLSSYPIVTLIRNVVYYFYVVPRLCCC